jgi:hypothetical protein
MHEINDSMKSISAKKRSIEILLADVFESNRNWRKYFRQKLIDRKEMSNNLEKAFRAVILYRMENKEDSSFNQYAVFID